jgi:hypothetical protein
MRSLSNANQPVLSLFFFGIFFFVVVDLSRSAADSDLGFGAVDRSRLASFSRSCSSSDFGGLFMAVSYGSTEQPIRSGTIPETTLTDIGRLVRAFAEIEDILSLYICSLARMSEGHGVLFLGRSALRSRLELARNLAELAGDDELKRYNGAFDQSFSEVLACRNAVAHGTFVGLVEADRLAFLTAKYDGPAPNANLNCVVETYTPKAINVFAKTAEDAISPLEQHLRLRTLRQKRLHKPLAPHRKAQPQQKREKKQKSRPRSSEA